MGDTLVFKTHAPKSAHHAIHVNCVLIGLHLRLVQPDRAGYGNGSMMSENGYKNLSKSLRDYIAFAFAVLIYDTMSVLIGLQASDFCQSL